PVLPQGTRALLGVCAQLNCSLSGRRPSPKARNRQIHKFAAGPFTLSYRSCDGVRLRTGLHHTDEMPNATVSIVDELENALKDGSPERRTETLRRVTDLFLGNADCLGEQQVKVFDDVLLHLIKRIETEALVQLSASLAPASNAPTDVIRHLAYSEEIRIAAPVLSQSDRLSE